MITKMKKLVLLTFYKEYPELLKQLQRLGSLHIESEHESAELTEDDTRTKAELIHLVRVMDECGLSEQTESGGNAASGKFYIEEIDRYDEDILSYNSRLQKIDNDLSQLEPWGSFDGSRLAALQKAGYDVSFYICEKSNYLPEWKDLYNAVEINRIKDKLYFITITPTGEDVSVNANKVILPDNSLIELQQQRVAISEKLELSNTRKDLLVKNHLSDLCAYKADLSNRVEYANAFIASRKEIDDKVMVLSGWFPVTKENEIRSFLEKHNCSYEISNAKKGDNVPVKLKNNVLTRMYEVLTEMYGLPNYQEFDPTPLIAPFFTLFFGLCLGDAGYGLILIALGFLMKCKMDKSKRGITNLVITLGAATTLIGGAMGTFFGVSLFDLNIPEGIKAFMISGKIEGTTFDKLMLLSILIGVIHLSLALTIKAITSTVRFGFMESLSAWGWLIFIVGSIVTGGLWLLKYISDDTALLTFVVIAGISALGIFLLNNIHRNPVANIGIGLWDTYNMATGFSGDILSYIRLYALGLAGGMLGSVFNMLAFSLKDSITLPVIDIILCGVVLVLGHALNIGLSCLSAFVHPLRLTFLEYFKNSGYEGNGDSYKPFKLHNF